jgi:AraC-like DNA-binding protein
MSCYYPPKCCPHVSGWLGIADLECGQGDTKGSLVSDRDGAHAGAHPTAAGALTRLAYARAKAAGIDVDPILKKTHLTLLQIEDPGARLRVRDQINFLNRVADDLQDDFLGFHLALKADLREIGWLYYVAESSETMGEALQRAARYSSIVNEGVSLHYADTADAVMTIRYVGVGRHLDRHQIEFVMTLLVRMCRQLTGLRQLPARVQFVHRRERLCPEFAELFGSDVEFGAGADRATLATAIRNMPTVSADPYLNKLLVAYFEEALSRQPAYKDSFRASVENAMVPLLPHGKARAAEIGRRLGTSQRTLARRLSVEGSSFSAVLEGLRSDLAKRYLADKDLSISEIAWLLGYQEVSAFTHACRRWTGQTPRAVRSELA